MKLIIVFTIIIVNLLQTSALSNRFSQNAVIYQLAEMFRGLMKLGDIEKNIPIIDPYTFDLWSARFNAFIHCEMNITNGAISGLSNFKLENFEFIKEETALSVTLKIPTIQFDSENYEMKGNIFEAVPISGTGRLYFVAKDVTINSKLYLKQSGDGKSVTLAKLENTSFAIKEIMSHTEYDKNIDDVLNAMTDVLLSGYLTRFSKFIANAYKDYAVITLNYMLNEYDTWSILATILHK